MSYIVPNEIPKSCNTCPYAHLVFQNPLSSKTPVKRYRCQVGEAPWRIIEMDFSDQDYKDKDCPLVAYNMDEVVKRIECVRDSVRSTSFKNGCNAALIEITRKGGV